MTFIEIAKKTLNLEERALRKLTYSAAYISGALDAIRWLRDGDKPPSEKIKEHYIDLDET